MTASSSRENFCPGRSVRGAAKIPPRLVRYPRARRASTSFAYERYEWTSRHPPMTTANSATTNIARSTRRRLLDLIIDIVRFPAHDGKDRHRRYGKLRREVLGNDESRQDSGIRRQ